MALDFCAALHAKECICWIFVVALRTAHRGLRRQLVEQRLGVLQVGGVEALGEPVVDLRKHRACLVTTALRSEPQRKRSCCFELEKLTALSTRRLNRFSIYAFD